MAAVAWMGYRQIQRQRLRDEYQFHNRVAVVTGGSRGLGLVIARRLGRAGAKVILLARDEEELRRACEIIQKAGGSVSGLRCDVGNEPQVRMAIQSVLDKYGRIDVLINNAGQIRMGPFENMTKEDFEESLRVHFWGPLHTILAVFPHMKARGEGRIVNVSSIGGKVPLPHLIPYSASKFALVGLSEGLNAELRRHNIKVTTVCPGLMRTGAIGSAEFKGDQEKEFQWFAIADSLPGFTSSAESAAQKILDACRMGLSEVITTVPAKLATRVSPLFPEFFQNLLSKLSSILPLPKEGTVAIKRGAEMRLNPSMKVVTLLSRKAALENNEPTVD